MTVDPSQHSPAIQGTLLVRQLFPQALVLRSHGLGLALHLRLLQFLVEEQRLEVENLMENAELWLFDIDVS